MALRLITRTLTTSYTSLTPLAPHTIMPPHLLARSFSSSFHLSATSSSLQMSREQAIRYKKLLSGSASKLRDFEEQLRRDIKAAQRRLRSEAATASTSKSVKVVEVSDKVEKNRRRGSEVLEALGKGYKMPLPRKRSILNVSARAMSEAESEC